MDERQNAGLVLTRRKGESIVIRPKGTTEPIVITVEPVHGAGSTKLIIRAPRSTSVNRAEVELQKLRAAGVAGGSLPPGTSAGPGPGE